MSAPDTESKTPTLPPEVVALQPQIAELCRKYGILRLSLFGSRARGDARPDSDYDFLVRFDVNAPKPFERYMDFYAGLRDLLEANIDFLDDKPLQNPYLRHNVESTLILVSELSDAA